MLFQLIQLIPQCIPPSQEPLLLLLPPSFHPGQYVLPASTYPPSFFPVIAWASAALLTLQHWLIVS